MMRYLNLDIKIDAGAGPDYQVTVQAPSGQACTTLHFPFSQMELHEHLQALQIALLRSSGDYRTTLSSEERAVQHFGQALFEALLTGEVGTLYVQTQRLAADQQTPTGVRLRLAIAPAHLAAVPWEFLCDPTDGSYPCLLPDMSLVRSLDLARPGPPLKVALPLRVLGMIASPSDQPKLEIEREQDRLRRAFAPLQESGQMELHWVAGQSWEALQDVLLYHGPWHIFHFIGHGGVHPQSGDGVLAFANERGTTHLLDANDLATLLAGRRLRLVVLNACEGARGNEHDVFSGTAATLARRGIPGVLAMQYAISDAAAVQLTTRLYSALAQGIPLDEAVVAARQAIKLSRSRTLEWGTPVLYLRTQDGILFELQARAGAPAPEQAPIHTPPPTQAPIAANWMAQARVHLREWRYDEALASFEQALMLDPNSFQASQGKALALMALERYEEAVPHWERLSQRAPADKSIAEQRDLALQEAARQAFARIPSGTLLHTCEGHNYWACAAAWSPDGTRLASIGNHDVLIWEAASGKLLQTCVDHKDQVFMIAWSPDGRRLASAASKGYDTVGLWDAASKADYTVRLWDAASGKLLHTCEGHTHDVTAVAWSPNGTLLASSSRDYTVRFWDAASGKLLHTCKGHTGHVKAIAWSPDGALVASASDDNTVRLWAAASGAPLHTCLGHTNKVCMVAWSPNGMRLASASEDQTVCLWDVAFGRLLFTCLGHEAKVRDVAWSPDGRRLASASNDATVRLWDAASGKLLQTCKGHNDWVETVAWSPDGARLASAIFQHFAFLWDAASGRLLRTEFGYKFVWSPDGTLLASASIDGVVRIWKA